MGVVRRGQKRPTRASFGAWGARGLQVLLRVSPEPPAQLCRLGLAAWPRRAARGAGVALLALRLRMSAHVCACPRMARRAAAGWVPSWDEMHTSCGRVDRPAWKGGDEARAPQTGKGGFRVRSHASLS
ncbi:unnamed protein product [Prorocentrum cordatum]|uniref:Uncharacterized protein n=1 Tax=Prorocentrum cordatum TaxID=2364126 RepID=A0ABN9RTT2_9DINO|nr:unnamed protein product [Polarella glacialis]